MKIKLSEGRVTWINIYEIMLFSKYFNRVTGYFGHKNYFQNKSRNKRSISAEFFLISNQFDIKKNSEEYFHDKSIEKIARTIKSFVIMHLRNNSDS